MRPLVKAMYDKYSQGLRKIKKENPELWSQMKKEERYISKTMEECANKKLAHIMLEVMNIIEDEDKIFEDEVVREMDPVLSGMNSFFEKKFISESRRRINEFRTRKSITA